MPTNPETGHTKNVANFQRLILLCQNFGAQYAPSNPLLSIANLQAAHTAAENSINDVALTLISNQAAINNRKILFKDVGRLSTRIFNYFKITNASAELIADVKGVNAKLQGYRMNPLPRKKKDTTTSTTNQNTSTTNPNNQTTNQNNQTTNQNNQTTNQTTSTTNPNNQTTNQTTSTTNSNNQTTNQTTSTTTNNTSTTNQNTSTTTNNTTANTENRTANTNNTTANTENRTANTENRTTNPDDKKHISASQMSYDNRAQFFFNYINLVASEPTYNPSEPDLQIRNLQQKAAAMKAATLTADTTTIALETSRNNRNNLLYHPATGIHFLATQIKQYIKAVFGVNSIQARQASQYPVTNPFDI